MSNEKKNTVNVTDEDIKKALESGNGKPKRKKKNVGRIVFNVIVVLLFIVVMFEAIIGMVNMNRINNDEKPIWYLTTKTTETELKTVTEYNLGLYKIVKTDTARETKTTLKPFFLSE